MILKILVLLHILAATIWTGGHLILSLGFLPAALRQNDIRIVRQFESRYEGIGIPALIVLLATGIYFIRVYAPDIFLFDLSDHYTRHLLIKLLLLAATVTLAIHARLVLIPKEKLRPLAYHIVAVTILSVLFVVVGYSARGGGLL
ncbi:CopD family protein [Algoriphagus namhaensis]|uniref:CopD family protein n=1 Tax=Algoriphagus namhaensis TaxID=915353 RepID=A0ABV8AUN1_9BACT